MPFINTDRKLRELQHHLDKMSASKTVDEFEDNFAAFLAAGRTVTLALQKDQAGNQNFDLWYLKKQDEMRNDELCKYFKDARNDDLHTGDTQIMSFYKIIGPITLSANPDQPLVITNRGLYDVSNPKTPEEKYVQRNIGNEEVAAVFLANAPKTHRGKPIVDRSPLTLCQLFRLYLEGLVKEAKKKFYGA